MQTRIDLDEQLNRYAATAQGQVGRGFSEYAGYAAAVGAGLAMAGGADAAIIYSGVQNVTASIDPSRQAGATTWTQQTARPIGSQLPGLAVVAGIRGRVIPGYSAGWTVGNYQGYAGVRATGGAKFLGFATNIYAGGYRLAPGAMIGAGGRFSADTAGTMAWRFKVRNSAGYSFKTGNFADGVTGIAGFQLANGDYGWIRLKVEDLGVNQPFSDRLGGSPLQSGQGFMDKVTVLGWAVETSGGPIAAGDTATVTTTTVPEPSSLALLAAGAAGLAGFRRRQAKVH